MAIPTDLKEASSVFSFTRWERWRRLILPAIFPYLVTGMLTASGGAWNASIVSEYFHFQGKTSRGLGAAISRATDSLKFAGTFGGNDGDVGHCGHHEPHALAEALPPGRHAFQARDLARASQ